MRTGFGQSSVMTPNAEPLQGSLFGEIEPVSGLPKLARESARNPNEELSDEYLTKDAKQRPRSKKNTKTEETNKASTNDADNPDTDLPNWHHHSLVDLEQLTPVLSHYVELKSKNPERVLLYRLGDFFECFFEDAIQLSQILELTLTGKEGGKAIGRVPMAGIPHHAAERYCAELIKQGLSVAICDQLENSPSKAGALLKRGITRVLTPGTVIEEGMLQARRNNWLVAIVFEEQEDNASLLWGLSSADVSTGDFQVKQGNGINALHQELFKIEASEVLVGESRSELLNKLLPEHIHFTQIAKTPFSLPEAEAALKKQYKINTIHGLGLGEKPLALRAAGGLVSYLQKTKPIHNELESYEHKAQIPLQIPYFSDPKDCLIIDAQTRRNLEITSTQKDGQFQGSLLWAIDRTLTAMGSRRLRRWIEAPLKTASAIQSRQSIVSLLVEKNQLRNNLRRIIRPMGDLERLAGRAGAGQAGARDLVAIANGIERLPLLAKKLELIKQNSPSWFLLLKKVDPSLIDLASKIKKNLVESPPLSLSEGGLINDGVDPLLDGLRNQLDDLDEWLYSQELLERKSSGHMNLKLQYHRTFGYFLSVSKSKASQVPDHWIRRQTLANEERFITPELKSREGKILQLKARAAQREYELFCNLRELVGSFAKEIRQAAKSVAGLDALAGLSEVAAANCYCPPLILESNDEEPSRIIEAEECRHPVVEQMLVEENFKPNDINLGNGTDLIILTGPNASGKSCYLRQIGLIQLLAQVGSWVPAKKATLSLADKIFTRVGAVDDLAAGQSTFMVEMSETAYILNHATNRSLVLLDEIGRGTSTYDGLSIACSVSEFLSQKIKSRSIFATHYHELNSLSQKHNNIENFQVLVEETNEALTFLHKVAPGGASKSYGIEAARLAGVPEEVVSRARAILKDLQKKNMLIK